MFRLAGSQIYPQMRDGANMRLTKFRVRNFRSVVDSGWIQAERVTALVGVNESGKTNLLLPLWKLNPAREGEIRPTSDYPKGNFASIRAQPGSFEFITAEFDCGEIAPTIAEMSGVDITALEKVRVTRYLDGAYLVDFPEYVPRKVVSAEELMGYFSHSLSEIDSASTLARESTLKPSMVEALTNAQRQTKDLEAVTAEDLKGFVSNLNQILPAEAAKTSSIVPLYMRLIEKLSEIHDKLIIPIPSEIPEVKNLIVKNLPRFVYYSNYGNLDSEIYLPHVVQNLQRGDLGAKEAAKTRTLRVLFNFVRLEPDQILELGRDFPSVEGNKPTESQIEEIATKKRERTILLNSAATELTKKFREWWRQGDYSFDFQADGDHFRIWVSDSKRPEKIELEDRSSGLQWFLSFYLIFLVESERDHHDAILLLDEPGLSLHPLAQRDLSAFFENLASTNQILYTTHSPFLVDADMLDRARKVFVGEDGSTKASEDLRRGSEDPRKSGATYAIYSALNMNVAESMLLGCLPVIVEGPSDQHYLNTIKTVLIANKRITPRRELVFPPSHGARNAQVVASILTGRDEDLPFIFLDGDEAGQKMAKDMRNGLYQTAKNRIITADKYVQFQNAEIEDLFPPDFMATVVDRWERRSEVPFGDVVRVGEPIVPQIISWSVSQGISLAEGWKVDLSRLVKQRAISGQATQFNEDSLKRWTQLFEDLLTDE